jgi:hypothetical protein
MAEQRSRSLTYDPITKVFTEAACMVSEIDIPEITRNVTVPVFVTKEKSAQFFRVTERKEIINFKVKFVPMNNDAGKKLLSETKKIVDTVLTKDFKPEVATINTFRNGELEKTITINDAFVKKGIIELDKGDYLHIVFEIEGLLAADY